MSTLCITVASNRSVLLLNLYYIYVRMYVHCISMYCMYTTQLALQSMYLCIHTLSYLASVLVHAAEHLKLHTVAISFYTSPLTFVSINFR